ncbi:MULTISPECIES: ABC transporter permease [Sporosarcina]|uniref:Putative hemin transport system permease protein HrtB n=2 Tax=Sporosarcina newyorkensis TaxID=759851 RepID=A0A1T4Y9K5_9BACL|nr:MULTISPECIES: ABC transporter permease [Sporosarcina]EGQ26342.1 ABC superfamily ATP binding cassette transporter, membrane protein [Sporosarcina newyorkensis 2681]MBY0223758.1 ABC transporter permease [Sporosarcina aquimarina]SKA98497.1 putative ABC transport system permease protein [Sporosarcina newyorkensis]
MFLAWSEIKRNKLRFLLITSILLLVSFLVFFLSGLAAGLANMNREAVDKWHAQAVVLTEESDKSLYQSSLDKGEADGLGAKETAVIGQMGSIADNGKVKKNVVLFGIEPEGFIMPKVSEGEVAFSVENGVIASDVLKDEGFAIGDTLELSSSDTKLEIIGFTDQARFNAAPVLYIDLDDLQHLKFGDAAEINADLVNAIVVKDTNWSKLKVPEDLEIIEVENFIKNLPGYTEQNMTLTYMIYFLFVISAAIVAIFLYVLTVQKISMFGLMKAQGISSGYLAKSVVAQTFILATIGVVVGFGLTWLAGSFLPSAVPVQFDLQTMIIYGLILITVAILGAVISVWTIIRIDPLEAIGG